MSVTEKRNLPSKSEILKILEEEKKYREALRENREYFEEHKEELKRTYGGSIIVILNKEIVETMEAEGEYQKIRKFFENLKAKYGKEKMKEAYITYVTKPNEVLLY